MDFLIDQIEDLSTAYPPHMLNEFKLTPSDVKSYLHRLAKHVTSVIDIYKSIRYVELYDISPDISTNMSLYSDVLNHDYSKFFIEDLIGQVWINKHYQENLEYPSDTIKQLADDAWTHHFSLENHHPQYWSINGGVDKMPDYAIVHMLCDWEAMSRELGGSTKDFLKKQMDTNKLFSGFTQDQILLMEKLSNIF